MFWGTPSQPGCLCNLREIIRRTQVDKTGKVFNVGDEFVVHAFRAHLTAGILHNFGVKNTCDPIRHTTSKEWLEETAKKLVNSLLMPQQSDDPAYNLHCAFLHHAFLYVDLREAKMVFKLSGTGSGGSHDSWQLAEIIMQQKQCILYVMCVQTSPSTWLFTIGQSTLRENQDVESQWIN